MQTNFNNACTKIYFNVLDYFQAKSEQRKQKKQIKKQRKEQARYEKACSNFNLIINPYDTNERYVVLSGELFRVVFKTEGVAITDSNGEFIPCKLIRLKVLERLTNE